MTSSIVLGDAFIDDASSPPAQDRWSLPAVMQDMGGVAGADDGREAQFAADDGGVRGAAAMVGDDGVARFMIGTQSGSVVEVTRIEPSTNLSMSLTFSIRQARPVAAAAPTERPVSRVFPVFLMV
jgi:hypothetical protein